MTKDFSAVYEYLPAWDRLFVKRRELYTMHRRRELILFVIEDMKMTKSEAREFERRALQRAAFALPEVFTLRIIQSLSEVCR